MATEIWVNIGTGNGMLPDDTKPLPEPMLTSNQCGSVASWQPFESIFTASAKATILYNVFENHTFEIIQSD